ncbi:YihY/virulence factor BrkB family protein [Pseudomonas sp. RIT-PI-AD]|uniref:YihY/virulence factor BrkB family protein n=1 Tax=Pseudomonas sp. RIT-PI-AD TaxID=3035294 RepID=UPI0021D7E861|nr:YihY/virulence factor BrkB family protein [Pseudomonas sp. RIT-PI-AD]
MQKMNLGGMGPFALAKRTLTEFVNDDMPTYASALAYQALFSMFPFLLFLLALVGALHLPEFFAWLRQQAEFLLPGQAIELVNPIIDQMQNQNSGFLSVGIVVALWSASSGIRSIMNALNNAYDVEERRPTWKRFLLSIVYTIGIAVLLLCAAGLMIIGPQVIGWLAGQIGLEDFVVALWTWLRWPVAVVLLMAAVATLYYVAPDVEQDFRFITPGSILAVVIWIVASLGFGFYVTNFADYNAMYGSIGAIIVLLLYFYISAAVLLLGAEVNAVIEHHDSEGKDPGEKTLPQ